MNGHGITEDLSILIDQDPSKWWYLAKPLLQKGKGPQEPGPGATTDIQDRQGGAGGRPPPLGEEGSDLEGIDREKIDDIAGS